MAEMANEENNKVKDVHVRKENEQKNNTNVEVDKPDYSISLFNHIIYLVIKNFDS